MAHGGHPSRLHGGGSYASVAADELEASVIANVYKGRHREALSTVWQWCTNEGTNSWRLAFTCRRAFFSASKDHMLTELSSALQPNTANAVKPAINFPVLGLTSLVYLFLVMSCLPHRRKRKSLQK